MLERTNAFLGNTLLGKLAKADAELLKPALENIDLQMGEELYTVHGPVKHAYFPVSGICSVVAENNEGIRIETGLIGREGFVGIPIIHYAGKAPSTVVVQAGGRALRVSTPKLLDAIQKSPSLNKLLLQFAHVFSVQVAQTTIANGHNTINVRLARWLLMCHDRADSPEFPMTHQFLSNMLAVRRAGITDALANLEGKKAIQAHRGRIVILSRFALQEIAAGAYGAPEQEYQRLIAA
jgi:CRP-like cAMP-binding protein